MKLLLFILLIWLMLGVLCYALVRGAALLSAEDNPREPNPR